MIVALQGSNPPLPLSKLIKESARDFKHRLVNIVRKKIAAACTIHLQTLTKEDQGNPYQV